MVSARALSSSISVAVSLPSAGGGPGEGLEGRALDRGGGTGKAFQGLVQLAQAACIPRRQADAVLLIL